jgi:hypothetical protein
MPDGGLSRKQQIAVLRNSRPDCWSCLRSTVICVLFGQHLQETSIRELSARRLLIACAETFGNSPPATEGGTRGRLGGSQEFPLHAG